VDRGSWARRAHGLRSTGGAGLVYRFAANQPAMGIGGRFGYD
jgi:hypothetical protein